MCNLSKGVEEKGIQKGILLSIRNLMETMGWPVEQVMEGLKIPEEEKRKYLDELKRNNEFFRPINILNRLLRKETEEQNKFYKCEAVKLEKENIKNTELIFEKMFYKNDLNKQIQEVEKEINGLRKKYELEDKEQVKETDLLKEKNMLFKMFEIDKIVEPTKEELDEIKEQNEE